jgi:hypothetical protein
LILKDLSDQIKSFKSLADEEKSRTTRKIGSQFKLVLQVIGIQDKTIKESIGLAGNAKLINQIISQMRSASKVELKNLEALSGGVKWKFAIMYQLEQWIVNNHETSLPKKKEQKQQKSVKTQTATDAVMECPPDDKQLHALFEIVTN